nr:MAG TPA: hypothetical protein [Caudoviricetes sp.]
MPNDTNTCRTCCWHDSFSWACFNGNSPYCADFTDDNCTCVQYEMRDDSSGLNGDD